ncbi:YihY/virulence factor BrkB family protein [Liquorilactobacillus satsumensis]|uniref:Ribonuclease BN n=1 Tax=Liquorilactobacillus satsumensis DSM 16230 = JCM 12392 TaxID=1423801 RepID=A0A0R1V4F6_9LACO|nr:YihY/virulence factor BrkB family protein [Liquorilactobacillus satsumensis]KRL97733.1 ribonuclease BN [Liquorilactobacillus satsumensis DSM 16230 = JCM 12392]
MAEIKKGSVNFATIKDVGSAMLQRSAGVNLNNTAIVIAYYSLLAIFPTIILLGNLMPLLNLNAATILNYLQTAVPGTIYNTLRPLVTSFLQKGNGGVISISALVALWAASRGVNALKLAMNNAYGVKNSQSAIVVRLASFFLTLVFVVLMVIIITLFSFGQLVLDYLTPLLHLPTDLISLFGTFKWPVTVVALFFIISLMYYFLPNAHIHLHLIFPGAFLATAGWVLLAQGFSIYVRYFARSVLSYGTIGTFIVLLFWLNYAGWAIMLGAVLNATLEEKKYHKIEPKSGKIRHYIEKYRPDHENKD